MSTSYSSLVSVGNRLEHIAVYYTGTLSLGIPQRLVDGSFTASQAAGFYWPTDSNYVEIVFHFFGYDVVIDEAKWYQNGSNTQGTWQWKGSNDGSTWSDIGSTFTLGGSTTQTQTSLNGNTTAYKYYKLAHVSGNKSGLVWNTEIEFKAEVFGSTEGTYSETLSQGNRLGLIDVTYSGSISSGVPNNLINGNFAANSTGSLNWSSTASAVNLVFDFKGISVIVTQFRWTQNGTGAQGTWQLEGSDDNSSWTSIGNAFTLGGESVFYANTFSNNETAYLYYRIRKTSGSTSNVYWLEEIEFRIKEEDVIASEPVNLTQLPILVLSLPTQPTEITQLPLLVINLPQQDSRVSQVPLLPVWTPTPIPLPFAIIPEVPVTEIWRYKTSVNISEQGKEQRSSIISNPNYDLKFEALILNDKDREQVYKMLFVYSNQIFNYPLYQYSVKLASFSSSGTSKLYFNPAHTDMRPGEAIAVFDTENIENCIYMIIDSVDPDGVTLANDLPLDVPSYWMVAPAPKFYLGSNSYSMRSIDGNISFTFIGENGRNQLRPSQNITLDMLDGYILITKRPLANDEISESFDRNVTVLDNESAPIQLRTNWPISFIGVTHSFLIKKYTTDLDYWRKFSDSIKGRKIPFLLPSWRNDLPLIIIPDLGSTVIRTSNIHYAKYFVGKSYRYVMIRSQAGTIYRKVLDILVNYDVDGQPISLDMKLSASIGSSAGSNQNMVVSIINLYRLSSDSISLTHDFVDSIIALEMRSINE